MEIFTFILQILEVFLGVLLVMFISSTVYLVYVVKRHNYRLIKDSISNPIFPNLDLRFFKKLQDEYLLVNRRKWPATINKLSFYGVIFCFFSLIFMTFIQELFRH